MKKEITAIHKFIKEKGKLVNKAGSSWGADRWELEIDGMPMLVATLEDDGYTRGVFCGELQVRDTVGRELSFSKGNETDLENLFINLF